MSKITLDNLSDNLKAYLEGLGLSEEQVLNLINENGLDEEELKAMLKDTMSINELNTNSKTIIGAINELFQSANNGKELIANAIGEPLDASDTFSAMSNDINSLLSTFKTNMMNNGITVESGDKFKSLIDKIATLADNEGKGIQYAEGSINNIKLPAYTSGFKQYSINLNIDFTPSILMINIGKFIIETTSTYYTANTTINSLFHNSSSNAVVIMSSTETGMGAGYAYISSSNQLYMSNLRYERSVDLENITYLAIGVGEEDTTLRDSLASILTEEGVSVTEEDDMASLITKVDEEFDRKNTEMENSGGLDIISATELPATGKENQICVITDNPVDNFIISNKYDELIQDVNIIGMYLSNTGIESDEEGTLYSLSSGNITTNYYFSKVCQGSSRLNSYYYSNNIWNKLTNGYIALVENGTVNNSTSGGFTANVTSRGLSLLGATNQAAMSLTKNKINLSTYNTVKLTYYLESTYGLEGTFKIGAFNSTISDIYYFDYGAYKDETPYDYDSVDLNIPKTKTLDISGWNGDCYFGVSAVSLNIVITDIIFF